MTTNLKCEGPVKVFLDRNVCARSVLIEAVTRKQVVRWGTVEIIEEVAGWQRKPLRNGDNKWIVDEVTCLPTVADLAINGTIELYISWETSFEGWSASTGAQGTKGDILAGVPIHRVDDAVDRSYFSSRTIDQVVSREKFVNFCEFLRKVPPGSIESAQELWDALPKTTQTNLSRISRFHELIDALPTRRHWPDAFHLWTAETHGVAYFLTMDQKFINALTQTAQISLPTRPVRPSELLADLGVESRIPLPVEGFGFQEYSTMID